MNRYRDWLEQAEIDLEKGRIDLRHEYFNWACFTAQQAAEKAVKGLCMFLGFEPWGHSITNMLRLLRDRIDVPAEMVENAQMLDAFYIPTRYPNGFSMGKPSDYYNSKMAGEALNACEKIIRFCKLSCDR